MDAKKYLSQVKSINIRLKTKARQVQVLEDSLTRVTTVISDTPKSATPNVHRMEDLIATKVDLEAEIVTDTAKLAEITNVVNSLQNELHVAILTGRYFIGLGWQDIADEHHVSISLVYQLHVGALEAIEKSIANYSKL